jgi:hypothetical protein
MDRYRVTMTVVVDVSAVDGKQAEEGINGLLCDCPMVRKQVKVEKLKVKRQNIQLAEFKPEDILHFVSKEERKREFRAGGSTYLVRMNSQRYFIFRENLCCTACGIRGVKMILEQNPSDRTPHFNLYAIENKKLVLMTKDHIQPKAYGGQDRYSNFQTMCIICNNLKGSCNLTLEGIAELRKIYNANRSLPKKKLHLLLEEAREKLAKHWKYPPKRYSKGSLSANTDIQVWKLPDHTYVGKLVYERRIPESTQIACIKYGTKLGKILDCEDNKILVKLSDEISFWVYDGYVDEVKQLSLNL